MTAERHRRDDQPQIGGIAAHHRNIGRCGQNLCDLADARGRFLVNHDVGMLKEPEQRSEEHTSELQSLMRISYAVFCLKKKRDVSYHSQLQTDYSQSFKCTY